MNVPTPTPTATAATATQNHGRLVRLPSDDDAGALGVDAVCSAVVVSPVPGASLPTASLAGSGGVRMISREDAVGFASGGASRGGATARGATGSATAWFA